MRRQCVRAAVGSSSVMRWEGRGPALTGTWSGSVGGGLGFLDQGKRTSITSWGTNAQVAHSYTLRPQLLLKG